MRLDSGTSFDVAILGTGIAGSMLGAILAKHGARVLLLDSEVHPRFAVGESTIPHSSLLLSIIAQRWGVPEIDYLAYPDLIERHVCSTCGIKRSFGFAYQRPGRAFDPREGHQFGTTSKDENHFFRQDIDAFLLHVALHYGAFARQKTRVEGIEIDGRGVRLETTSGTVEARYLVDASGYKSPVAERFGLRLEPPPLAHHARTLFTHMVDVKPFEECEPNPHALSWHQSTLHHVFERGWIWVIPFNNREGSTNPLVSVGLTVDPRRYPRPDVSPEEEFGRFLREYPSVAKQFEDAKVARPWVSTGRFQFTSRTSTGYRFCLMSHASGAIDPLFSRGLINTYEGIHALVDPLLAALDSDDFSVEAFAHVDDLQRRVLAYNDTLVNCSFISWNDFDLWNAWIRVWALGTILTEFRLMNALTTLTEAGPAGLAGEASNPVFSEHEDPDYAAFFPQAAALVERFERGTISAAEAAAGVFELTGRYPFPVLLRQEAMRRAGWQSEEMSERNLQRARDGYRWALTHPYCRDLFGNSDAFFRWREQSVDPHLAAEARPSAEPTPVAAPD